ncbi:TonB-dependent receptor [Marinilabilia salmonicolor]|uniref:TonB-dependent receptor n=1 Tax=Marinilabilia salmonicolor TaxID=989 RepID=UPI00056C0693|nr:TonB-dependent receptor [Marinilabilia salmonicolor]
MFLIFFLQHSFALAQVNGGIIEGQIVDEAEMPLFAVSVALGNSGRGTVTDADGKFVLRGVESGHHTLLTSAVGYKRKSVRVAVPTEAPVQLTIRMEEETLEIDEVRVVGKNQAAMQREKGFAISGVNMQEFELQTVQAGDMLDRTAGVRIRREGGLGSDVQYNINGLSGKSIKIFLNGIPIENYGASFSLSSIPNSMIERIDVYKGVVPAYLGDDALGGAINVITRKRFVNSLNVSYSVGSFNTHQAAADGRFRDERTGFTFNGNAFYNYSDNDYEVWGDKVYTVDEQGKKEYITARRFHDSYQSAGIKADVGFTNVPWADRFMVGGLISEMEKDIQHGMTMEIVYGNRAAAQNTGLLHAEYRKRNFLTDDLEVDLFTSFSRLERRIVDTIPYMYNWQGSRVLNERTGQWYEWSGGAEAGDPTLNEDKEDKWSGRVRMQYLLSDRNKLSFNLLASNFSRRPDDPLRPESERELIDTRYLSKRVWTLNYEHAALGDKLKATAFFKYYFQNLRLKDAVRSRNEGLTSIELDDDTRDKGYGVALSYAVHPELKLMASAENALRLPSGSEIFGVVSENIDPAYGLKPERSRNLNLGFDAGPFQLGLHQVGVSTNFFYRDITGMIKRGVPDQFSESTPHVNLDDVRSTGVDVELNYHYQRTLSWVNGASLSNPRFNREFNDEGAKYNYYGDRLRNEPYFTFNSNVVFRKTDLFKKGSEWSLQYNFSYVHEFYRNWASLGGANKDVIPTQIVHDAGMRYTFPGQKLTLSTDVRNMFNEQVFDNWALQKPGRAFYAKITYKIN